MGVRAFLRRFSSTSLASNKAISFSKLSNSDVAGIGRSWSRDKDEIGHVFAASGVTSRSVQLRFDLDVGVKAYSLSNTHGCV
jgi:hypothetical protein